MARIQSSVGLISGLPIVQTVDQLMAISARPRDLLVKRTEQLRTQQVAVTDLMAQVVGIEFALKPFGDETLFNQKAATPSDKSLLSATITGEPAAGSHRLTPVRKAQSHQLLSDGFAASDTPLGAGEIALRFGGFVDRGVLLEELNAGTGVQPGKMRITDRSGLSAVIDLRFAQTIDDVMEAINSSEQINVTVSAYGDRLRLVDQTGETVSNLKVQEVGAGSTAADLGLAGINVAANEAVGADILRLHEELALDRLNDGNGVTLRQGVADLEVTFRDGSAPLQIDFQGMSKGATPSTAVTDAAHGVDAQIQFTSVATGADSDGYRIAFVDDPAVTAGNETVELNEVSKRISFHIDAGETRAYQIVDALARDSTASRFFTAAAAPGGNGSGFVDVSDTATTSGGAIAYTNEQTLGDILGTINAAAPERLRAQISASGDRIELIDLTTGSGTFSVRSLYGSAAEDLGLAQGAVDGVISGRRRLAGLKTVLLDSLSGGQGLGTLGLLSLKDRTGQTASVSLAGAETLGDVVEAINAAGVGVQARMNATRNGLLLSDTTAGTGALEVVSGDATGTAEKLGIAVTEAVSSVDSGSLDLQTFHEQLSLDELNRGRGIARRSFTITDSAGKTGAVNLTVSDAQTVGDVMDLINGLSIGVEAKINDTGDGILLLDTAGGAGALTVKDAGKGTAAADLRIAGTGVTVERDGMPAQIIDGTTTLHITLGSDDTLQDLVERINDADAGIAASLFSSSSGAKPYRLALVSQIMGSRGELLVDAASLDARFHETVAAQDALLLVGSSDSDTAAAFASSSSNDFEGVIDGVTVTVQGESTDEVTIQIESTNEPIVAKLQLFVDRYNQLRKKVDDLTYYNQTDNSVGTLFGSSETLRIEVELAEVVTRRFFGAGPIQSLEELGLSLNDQGQLQFDKRQFEAKMAASPEAVRQFFTQAEFGAAARFSRVTQQLAGAGNSLLLGRTKSLQRTIDSNEQRITDLTSALTRERESLLKEFYRLEEVLGRMQTSLAALEQIQPVAPLVSSKG